MPPSNAGGEPLSCHPVMPGRSRLANRRRCAILSRDRAKTVQARLLYKLIWSGGRWDMARTRTSARTPQPGESAQPMRVAAYVRVSTDEQAESGLGLGDQRRRVQGM